MDVNRVPSSSLDRPRDLPSCVLGDGGIIVVWLAGSTVINDVFEDGSEANSVVNVWLLLLA